MSKKPLISIGLPTYNRAATLGRAIESVLDQDYQNFELLISDNASTDDTEAICLRAAQDDKRVKYLRQQNNQGLVANFREALRHSGGEFFMWLADDDWLEPDHLSRCMSVFLAEPQHSLVCGNGRYFQNGAFIFDEEELNLSQDSGTERVLSYYRRVGMNGVFFGLMRRDLISKLPFENKLGADWLLTAQVAFSGKVRVLTDLHLNRSVEGASQDLTRLAMNMGFRGFRARYPHLNIAASVFKDVLWKSPVYRSLSTLERLKLAAKSSAAICNRYVVLVWRKKLLGPRGFRATLRETSSRIRRKTIKTNHS
jgi:glycosyltransferase involved in cell wall biosynthesis